METELAVIGAGPGGIAAALEASRAGVAVTVLDENARPGGQIYKQFEAGFRVTSPHLLGRDYRHGQELLSQFETASGITRRHKATVWGIFDNRLAFHDGEKSSDLTFKKLVIATGAYDRPVPLPGWTLPGVFTAGGAQRMIKTFRVLPGSRILLAGTGPLNLVLAHQILGAGGHVEAVLEAGRVDWPTFLPALWRQWDNLLDGFRYLGRLWTAGVPVLRRHLVVEIRGDEQVREAVIAEVDRNWRPKPHTRRILKVDAVCLGYGLVPSSEMANLAGCDLVYAPELGGFVPRRSEVMETSLPGIYAVGDGSGVMGSKTAMEEGRIAGTAVALSLKRLAPDRADTRIAIFRKRLQLRQRFAQALHVMTTPRPGLYELAREDTIICRCEEITLGMIEQALADGAANINEIKRLTRTGMGRCQGRMCGPALYEILAGKTGEPMGKLRSFRPRPPLKPVPLGILAADSED